MIVLTQSTSQSFSERVAKPSACELSLMDKLDLNDGESQIDTEEIRRAKKRRLEQSRRDRLSLAYASLASELSLSTVCSPRVLVEEAVQTIQTLRRNILEKESNQHRSPSVANSTNSTKGAPPRPPRKVPIPNAIVDLLPNSAKFKVGTSEKESKKADEDTRQADSISLEYSELNKDKELVLVAMQTDGSALEFAYVAAK